MPTGDFMLEMELFLLHKGFSLSFPFDWRYSELSHPTQARDDPVRRKRRHKPVSKGYTAGRPADVDVSDSIKWWRMRAYDGIPYMYDAINLRLREVSAERASFPKMDIQKTNLPERL